MSRRVLLAAALLAAGPAQAAPRAGSSATVLYTVRPGDTLAALARGGFVGADAVVQVERLNHVTAPRRLRSGRILRIPRSLLRDEGTDARIKAWSGPVTVTVAGQSLPVRIGAMIGESAQIRTGRNGFVTLRLRDGSAISLPSQSEIAITRLRRILLTGAVEREFTLGDGGLHTTVTHMVRPESTFRVVTPLTVSAVRGTEFRVAYVAARAVATTAVDEGTVQVDPRREQTSVPVMVAAGLGVAASAHGVGAPTVLLPAPALVDPGRVQSGEQIDFHLAPTVGAVAYHVQISRDAGALDVVAEATGPGPDFAFPSIAPGSWFVQIAGIDPQGIEGAATSYAFDRFRNQIDGTMATGRAGRHRTYLFRWDGPADGQRRYRFRLWRDGEQHTPVVDEVALQSQSLDVRDLGAGDYHWQVIATLIANGRVIESRSPARTFHIASPR